MWTKWRDFNINTGRMYLNIYRFSSIYTHIMGEIWTFSFWTKFHMNFCFFAFTAISESYKIYHSSIICWALHTIRLLKIQFILGFAAMYVSRMYFIRQVSVDNMNPNWLPLYMFPVSIFPHLPRCFITLANVCCPLSHVIILAVDSILFGLLRIVSNQYM